MSCPSFRSEIVLLKAKSNNNGIFHSNGIGIQLFNSLTTVQHDIIVQSNAETYEYRWYLVSSSSYLYCQLLLPESKVFVVSF